ncbi:MAG: TIGR01212 family radical SAM protein [Clostridiales bacterium]|nr:TIGR01212 family radical SAM protein [Clostridiales bacterium]
MITSYEEACREWNGKPYHSLDFELKKRFGQKTYKIALETGCSCPNRDGTLGTRGCIFCSQGGSGEFAIPPDTSVTEQISRGISFVSKNKAVGSSYIAYFQSYTNTYAPVSRLEPVFMEAIQDPRICGLSIATRPDCLPPDILDLIYRLNQIKPVWIELGLQTIHEKTASFIRRGYSLPVFTKAVLELKQRSIPVIVHVILGLPGETKAEILQTIQFLSHMPIHGIKLQLLHVLKHTDLEALYQTFPILSREDYIGLLINCLELLPAHVTIHRLTGDPPRSLLLAPAYSTDKRGILNQLHKTMKELGSYQGKRYQDKEDFYDS